MYTQKYTRLSQGMIWCPPDTCVCHITPPGGVASLSPDVLPRYARALGKVLPSGEFWVSQASNPATCGTTKLDLACVPCSSSSSNPVSSHEATSHKSQEPRSSQRLNWGDGQTRDESASLPASQSSTSAELSGDPASLQHQRSSCCCSRLEQRNHGKHGCRSRALAVVLRHPLPTLYIYGKVLPSGEFWVSQASNTATFGTTKLDLACVPCSSPSSNPVSSHAATSHESQEPRSSWRLDLKPSSPGRAGGLVQVFSKVKSQSWRIDVC
jgi:hypothetical protein